MNQMCQKFNFVEYISLNIIKMMTEVNMEKKSYMKSYFKFMLANRKSTVNLTATEIKKIIENDLEIKLDPPDCLYAQVCIKTFLYFVENWPEWSNVINSSYTEEIYNIFMEYLKNKLISLKKHEDAFNNMQYDNIVDAPNKSLLELIEKNKGMNPFILSVKIPEDLWQTSKVIFKDNTTDVILTFESLIPLDFDLKLMEILHYPFVKCQFYIPNLCSFTRSTPFIFERLFQAKSYFHVPKYNKGIISIESDGRTFYDVYSHQVLKEFFVKLCDVLLQLNVSEYLNKEISNLYQTFLKDLYETNLTVCEGSIVTFVGGGGAKYFSESALDIYNDGNEQIVYRTDITPVVSYYFKQGFKAEDIADDGSIKCFEFLENIDEKLNFIQAVNRSLSYECLLCDKSFKFRELKAHMQHIHPLDSNLKCAKCFKSFSIQHFLNTNWRHDCVS